MNQNMKRITGVIWWTVVSAVLILATLIISIKLLLPYVDSYRSQIERNLSQISGYEIRIDNISAKLEGLDPTFSITGVSVLAEGEAKPLQFERLMVRFNFWQSVQNRAPNFSYIRFYQTRISLTEIEGRWSLTGLPVAPSDSGGGFARIFNYFLDQRQISLLDTQIAINGEKIGQFELLSDAVYLQRTNAGVGISARVQHQNYDDEFKLTAEIKGDFRAPETLTLDAEFDLPEVSISSSELMALEKFNISQLDLGAKLWLSYANENDVSLLGFVNLAPKLTSGETIKLESKLNSRYTIQDKTLSLQLTDLQLEKQNTLYPKSNIVVEANLNSGGVDLGFDRFDLGLATQLAVPYLNKTWFVTGMLEGLQAQGLATNGHLKVESKPALSISYEGNLAIDSSAGYRNIPSINSVDALLTIDNAKGSIAFASNDAELSFPLMYDESWPLDGIAGEVNWGAIQDAFVVSANDLYLYRKGADVEGDFRLEIVKGYTDTLALDIHANDLDVADGLSFIPKASLSESARAWLDNALLAGRASNADFVLQTGLVQGANPQFLVDVDASDARVKFAPDWPFANDVAANASIDRRGVEVNLIYAKLDNVEANELSLSLPFADGGLGELELQGQVSDDLADVMALLMQTNLAESVLQPFKSWQVKGPGSAQYHLILPLSQDVKAQPYFNLALNLADAALNITDLKLEGEVVTGQLNYDTNKGIYNSSFDVKAFDGRATLDLFGDVQPQGGLAISANIQGDVNAQEVMQWQNLPSLLTRNIQGSVAFNAGFSLDPEKVGVIHIHANSDLVGASLSLPRPFAKLANVARPFAMSLDLTPGQVDVSLSYEQKYRSKLRFNKAGFYGGHALIDEPEETVLKISPGLSLQGQLPHVEIAAWRKLFNEPDENVSAKGPQPLRIAIPEWLSYLHLIADQVRLNQDNLLHNVKLDYDKSKAVSDLYLTSEELGVKLSKDLHGPVVNFSYLSWNSADTPKEVAIREQVEDRIRAQQIPSMTLNISELVINDKPYGDWRFLLTNMGDRVRVDPISTELEGGDFSGSLFWQDDQHSNVELTLAMKGENIDELTQKFSPEALLTSSRYDIGVSLSWLGTPFDIQRETLTGRIDLLAENGVIEKINELPSFLKALGVFNIHSLARRLTLDFSDVSSEGLTYDKISAQLSIQEGILNTQEPLRVVSPAVEVELKGQANLINETLNENLVASFPLGNTLPIAGLLLGVPQVAGLLYITDKIFGSQLSKVTSVEYMIKGSFADPEITPVIHTPKTNKKNDKNRDK